jgi:hypothetical protein
LRFFAFFVLHGIAKEAGNFPWLGVAFRRLMGWKWDAMQMIERLANGMD